MDLIDRFNGGTWSAKENKMVENLNLIKFYVACQHVELHQIYIYKVGWMVMKERKGKGGGSISLANKN